MEMHKLLSKQLNRLGFNYDTLPTDLAKWQELLSRLNTTYTDHDHERYLSERSMKISSHELQELNSKLENAQRIAKIGYVITEIDSDKTIWSKELYKLLRCEPSQTSLSLKQILELEHTDDQKNHHDFFDNVLKEGKKAEIETRIKCFDGEYHWFRIIVQSYFNDDRLIKISGVLVDIDYKKQKELEIESLNKQLIESARHAGMSEVATSILHNVGNILNSVNVSLDVIKNNMDAQQSEKLTAIGKLLSENKNNINEYLTQDSKGKLIPPYLVHAIEKLNKSTETISLELFNLMDHFVHIKEITEMQNNMNIVSSVNEKLFVPDIIDTALKMAGSNYDKLKIKLISEYNDNIFITSDKAKLILILVNLIRNAKDSLKSVDKPIKTIIIKTELNTDNDSISIIVKDNGIGIDNSNLTRIFSFGFTTKDTGHGFGLHSSALAAVDLGGQLLVCSDGHLQGAEFRLVLPLKRVTRSSDNEREKQSENYSY